MSDGNQSRLRVLFSEGSSLTAREFASVLGPAGHHLEALDPDPICICRFSRWVKRVRRCPAAGVDPIGYLQAVNAALVDGAFDVLLPTHEQAWLFSVAKNRLVAAAGLAVSAPEAFARVQSKAAFAQLLDEVGLPQPRWAPVMSVEQLERWKPPYYLKAPFSTAGTGVRRVAGVGQARDAFLALRARAGQGPLMAQAVAEGQWAQVQALFDHGRLVAAHETIRTAVGLGQSAAGRVSVRHAFARSDVARLGKLLEWHGGLALDYIFQEGRHWYIECNPRTVEPANAVASGVDLASSQLALSLGQHPDEAPPGRIGVRTHGSLAVLLGIAAQSGRRTSVIAEAIRLAFHRRQYRDSGERLSPIIHDPPSAIPLAVVASRMILAPGSAARAAGPAIARYAVPPAAIERMTIDLASSRGS